MNVEEQLHVMQESLKWMKENDLSYDAAFAQKYLNFLINSWRESINAQLLQLNKEQQEKKEELPNFREKPLTSIEFYRLYPTVGHPNNVGDQVRKDPERANYFIQKDGRKYLVKPKSFLYHLYKFGSTRMRNRVAPILKNMGII